MTEEELETELVNISSENEVVEFKECKHQISSYGSPNQKKSIFGYLVALGNEGDGTLYLGVDDKGKVVGTSLELDKEIKQEIFRHLKVRIVIDEVKLSNNKRVFVIRIPRRPLQDVYRFYGVPLMRVGDQLLEMDTQTLRSHMLETCDDFSAQIVPDLALEDLDLGAIEVLRRRYINKTGNQIFNTLSNEQLLTDLELQKGSGLTYAALIILGREQSLSRYLSEAELVFEFRNKPEEIHFSERYSYRNSILLSLDAIWNRINLHNQIHQYQEGMIRFDISTFNEKTIREALLNAVVHRDYQQKGSIFIKQTPIQISFESPGGFLSGITPYNAIDKQAWRNRLLAEVLSKLGYIERSGQGVDLIYQESIKEGKGSPTYLRTDAHSVILDIPAVVTDPAFVQYLEKVSHDKMTNFSVRDLIILQRVKDGDETIKRTDISRFLSMGIIEKIGRTNDTKYILSQHYYQFSNQLGQHTRLRGLSREVKKEMIRVHLARNNSGGSLDDFAQAFPDLKRQDISNLLQELKRENVIFNEGKTNRSVWKIKSV